MRETGKYSEDIVCGQAAGFWIWLFDQCYEKHYDGGRAKLKGRDSQLATYFYHRLEWPSPGGLMVQYNHVVEILNIINDEEARRLLSKVE